MYERCSYMYVVCCMYTVSRHLSSHTMFLAFIERAIVFCLLGGMGRRSSPLTSRFRKLAGSVMANWANLRRTGETGGWLEKVLVFC